MKINYYVILILGFFSSCFYNFPENIEWETEKYQSSIIRSSSNHLAFPDIVRYNDAWYIAYRESDIHGLSAKGSLIKVLRSTDFVNWEECNSFFLEGYDLRDPKFSYDEKTHSIYLHFFAISNGTSSNQIYKSNKLNLFTSFKIEYHKFDTVSLNKLPLPQDKVNYWLWRPEWSNGKLYVAGYYENNVIFLKYNNLTENPIAFSSLDNGSEVTIRFYDTRLYALVRRKDEAHFGTTTLEKDSILRLAHEANISFQWQTLENLREFGGPNMIIDNGVAYIGGRSFDENSVPRTAIYKYSLLDNRLKLIVYLESYFDNSYPGMVLLGNKLYGVYYTASANGNKNEIKTFIITI